MINKEIIVNKGKAYIGPEKQVEELNKSRRKQKETDKVEIEKLLKESIDKAATKERKAALAHRYMEEKKQDELQLAKKKVKKEVIGHPDISQTVKSSKEYEYYHPGKWMKTKIENKEMWSCCASEIKYGRGCQYRVIDKMGWKYNN